MATSSTRHKIIVGIDYGTTFSGVSYVTTDKSDIGDINIISAWPGEQHSSWKTPTRIAYARENPQIQSNKWGFEVYPKLISYSWAKLLLDKSAARAEHDDPALSNMAGPGMLQLPPFRDAAGVCEDFLREVYQFVSRKLRQQITDLTFENTPMECWITLPAIWSDEAKDATLTAAKNAGFGKRTQDKLNENILICDCGGGTVDITTYTITQISPVLEFDELCIGTGGKCGSTYIDRNLHSLLSRRFSSSFDHLPNAQKDPGSKFMLSFEHHKRDFGLSDDRDIRDLGPIRLDVPDSEYYDEEERMVKLAYEDMQSLFDPVVAEITSLVDEQVKEAKERKNAIINRIILVGGFAESPYLNDALEEWSWCNGDMMLICPEYPQSAVVRGAALRGLEGVAPRVKHARMHYGIPMSLPFRDGIDPEENAFFNRLGNRKLCKNRIKWLISKGEEVVQGTSRTASCRLDYDPGVKWVSEINLFACSSEDAPEYWTHPQVDKVGVIQSDFAADFNYGPQTKMKYNSDCTEPYTNSLSRSR